MIAFLRPGALWALPLSGIPFLIHFWGRVRARPTPFTALDLLREAAQTRFAPERIRRWLLLFVRSLLLLFLILFWARPGIRGVGGRGTGGGVILLDASYSLGVNQSGESAFDRARRIARDLIQSTRPPARWGLVIFSDRIECSLSSVEGPTKIIQALEAALPTFRGTSYATGFAEAGKMVKEGESVLLLSDMAAHGMSRDSMSWNAHIPVAAVEVVSHRANGAITGMSSIGPGTGIRVDICDGGDPIARTWSLRRGGRIEARGTLAPGKTSLLMPPFSAADRGTEGELILNSDGLQTDDHWFFVGEEEKPFTVCVVNGAPSLSPEGDETYYLRPLLDSLTGAGIKTVGASPGDLAARNLAGIQVVLLLNPPPLSESAVDHLVKFVGAGGGLWVTAGDRGGAPSLKNLLPIINPLTENLNEGLSWSGEGELAGLKDLLWERVRVEHSLSGDVRPGAQVLLRTVHSRRPILTSQSFGLGRVACWGSTIDRDWTNLPAKPAFPLLVGHLLPWLSGDRGQENRRTYFVGDTIQRPGEESKPLFILDPDGKSHSMSWVPGQWQYAQTNLPGYYQIRGAHEEKIAVNVKAEQEGNLSRVTSERFKSFLGGTPLQWIPAEKSGAEEIRRSLSGRDLTPPLAVGIAVLLLFETILLFYNMRWKKS